MLGLGVGRGVEYFIHYVGRDSLVGIATRYGLEVRGSNLEIFRTCPDQPWGQPSLQFSLSGYSGRGVVLTTHTLLAPRLKKE
jgi:hypothetical protein